MQRRSIVPVLLVAVLPLMGCTRSDDGIATDGTAATSTVIASAATLATSPPTSVSSPVTAPPGTAAASSVPVTPPTPLTSPTPLATLPTTEPSGSMIVYAGPDGYSLMPVGWWDGEWHSLGFLGGPVESVPAATPATVTMLAATLDAPLAGVAAPAAGYQCVEGPELPSIAPVVDVPEPEFWPHAALALGAIWDVQPRPVRAVGLDAPDYQAAGEALVPTDTGADPTQGDVTQVLRADLDGDGIEEVLFTFERQTEPLGLGAPGDFSLVVARLPDVTGNVVDQVIYSHVTPQEMEFPSPDRARVMAVGDLNGDATMEVAIDIVYWEGAGVEVFELAGGELRSVMEAGCGV